MQQEIQNLMEAIISDMKEIDRFIAELEDKN
jgi:hypothetical protein